MRQLPSRILFSWLSHRNKPWRIFTNLPHVAMLVPIQPHLHIAKQFASKHLEVYNVYPSKTLLSHAKLVTGCKIPLFCQSLILKAISHCLLLDHAALPQKMPLKFICLSWTWSLHFSMSNLPDFIALVCPLIYVLLSAAAGHPFLVIISLSDLCCSEAL